MKRATITDIANAAGVSETSVSLVINGRPNKISESTKKKILSLAKELSYVPNSFARGLVTKKSQTIGLIIPDIENSYFASFSKEVSSQAEKNGYIVLLLNSNDSHSLNISQINNLIQRNVDGLILVVPNESYHLKDAKELEDVLSNLEVPYVLADRDFPDFNANKVFFDNLEGGYLATKSLLELGHKKIACITGPNDSFSSIQRLNGYKKALSEYKIPFNDSIIVEGDFRIQSGLTSISKLDGKDFDSIFCFNDMMAFGANMGLKNEGKKIPEDISIVSYDNNILSSFSELELDTINQDPYILAEKATSLLLSKIEDPSSPNTEIKLQPELIKRNSSRKI